MASSTGRGRRAPWALVLQGRRGVATATILTAIGLHAIDVFVMSTVMPSVVAEIGGAAFYAWLTAVYMVATIVGAASAGPVQARWGLRAGYVGAVGLFGVGGLAAAVAPDMAVLIAGRAVQGWGGGLLLALSYVLIRAISADRLRPRVFAVVSTMWGVAVLVGPAVGGIFAEIDWWRGAFWFQVPVTVLFVMLALRIVPRGGPTRRSAAFPLAAIALLCGGAIVVAAAGNLPSVPAKAILIALAVVMTVLALRRDHGGDSPMFPSRAFVPATPAGAMHWMFVLLAMTPTGVGIYMPLVMQTVHGFSPLEAGYFGCLLALGWSTAAISVAGLRDRGVRRVLVAGLFLAASALGVVAFAFAEWPPLLIAPLLMVAGSGIGMCLPHYTTRIMRVARHGEEAVTAASVTTVRSLGVAFGSALAGMIANLAGLAQGPQPATVVRVAHAVIGFAACAPLLGGVIALWLVARHGAALGLAGASRR